MMATGIADAPRAPGGFLDRARTVAGPGFNRWLVPPCAIAIHLCIGISDPVVCKGDDARPGDHHYLRLAGERSRLAYSIFFAVLAAAAIWGGWLKRVGPGKVRTRRISRPRSISDPT
jgi:hypothetical protein